MKELSYSRKASHSMIAETNYFLILVKVNVAFAFCDQIDKFDLFNDLFEEI